MNANMEFVYDSENKKKIIMFYGQICVKKHCHIQQHSCNKEQILLTRSLFQSFAENATQRNLHFVQNGLAICLVHLKKDQQKYIKKHKRIPPLLSMHSKHSLKVNGRAFKKKQYLSLNRC